MLKIFAFLKGYLLLEVTGGCVERFMNLCANRNILLWNVYRISDGYQLYISLKSFWKLKDIVRKSGVRVVVLRRIGLPFFMPFFRKRMIFFLSVAFLLGLFLFSQLLLWHIEIIGNVTVTSRQIMKVLEEDGIHKGILLKNIKPESLEKQYRNTYNQITWITIYLEGTTLYIQLKENDKPIVSAAPKEEADYGTDLVASADGVLVSAITRKGTPVARIGDTVQKGDVLVSGIIEIPDNDGNIIKREGVDSDADLSLRVRLQKNFSTDLTMQISRKTGKQKRYFYCAVGEKTYLLGLFAVPYQHFSVQRSVLLEKEMPLPLCAGTYEVYEEEELVRQKTKETYTSELETMVEEYMQILGQKDVQIEQKNGRIKKSADKIILDVSFVATGPFYQQKRIAVVQDDLETVEE